MPPIPRWDTARTGAQDGDGDPHGPVARHDEAVGGNRPLAAPSVCGSGGSGTKWMGERGEGGSQEPANQLGLGGRSAHA
jgi:hypothetical protein